MGSSLKKPFKSTKKLKQIDKQGSQIFQSEADMTELVTTPQGQAPRVRGPLEKWTNYAKGYQARYFVLEDGVLSYFKDEADLGNASRGSISLRIAQLSTEHADKQRFDIIGKGSIRYHLRAKDREDATRWIWALKASMQYFKDQTHKTAPGVTAEDSDATLSSKASTTTRNRDMAKLASLRRESSISDDDDDDGYDENAIIPHQDTYAIIALEIKKHISVQANHLANLRHEPSALPKIIEINKQLVSKFEILSTMSVQREAFLSKRIRKLAEAKRHWEQNMTFVAEEQQQMERVLARSVYENRRKRIALKAAQEQFKHAVANTSSSTTPLSNTPPLHSPTGTISQGLSGSSSLPRGFNEAIERIDISGPKTPADILGPEVAAISQIIDKEIQEQDSDFDEDDDEFFDAIDNNQIEAMVAPTTINPQKDTDSLSLDEIEKDSKQNQLANDGKKSVVDYISKSYKGHEKPLRTRLPIDADNRPSISLWAILKSSVGKDMSKITLPVILNEPISMLCRMAEDMEFTECLDVAAHQRDPAIRIMYVAAFAMSNYSSTSGRIAKPFNPLLGETFEYVRPDKCYRYVSEQVSHHPPVSACFAESMNFDYFGEVDVKSKFWGKSFELWPQGVAHVNLKVSKEFFAKEYESLLREANGNPNAYTEHYTFKKVVTCVNGIILGSPSIDHYGDMTIRNHVTGHKCVLTFKPRGWRGKDAAEIKGYCESPSGERLWDIAGRWTDRLIARKVGEEYGDLSPDSNLTSSAGISTSPLDTSTPTTSVVSTGSNFKERAHLLLWKNSPKPKERTPFNLTPFAMTLIDQPAELTPYLCPTDTRFRPDQRCMERGEYDQAGVEKNRLEEKQRATRKRREAGELPEWTPRWFKRSIDPDTGEPYWEFDSSYWDIRNEAGDADGDRSKWVEVQDIY